VLQWREEITQGKLFGPTLFTSGPKLEGFQSMWAGDIEINTIEEMNNAIDSLARMKVDFIKITDNTLKPDLYLEILREAKKRGFKTSAHIPYSLTMEQVSSAGLGAVEHGSYLLKASSTKEKEFTEQIASGKVTYRDVLPEILSTITEEKAVSTYTMMAKNGTAVVPTLNISFTTAYLDQQDHANDAYQRYIGKGLLKTYNWRVERAAKDDEKAIALRHGSYEKTKSLLPWVQKAGVKIVAGTDAGYLNSFVYPGMALHLELLLFVEAGLTPLQALQSSIVNGPWFLEKSAKYGAIESGKYADLLLLDENPLLDITATQKIHAVILKGNVFDRKALDHLLEEIAAKNQ
jgi:imidazolonepropionase-like amidohydrolase